MKFVIEAKGDRVLVEAVDKSHAFAKYFYDTTERQHVYPDNALHRVWSQEICKVCGWKSEPFEGEAMGFGGILNCPECQKAERSPTLEGCYGNGRFNSFRLGNKKTIGDKS